VLAIPQRALRYGGNEPFVYTLEDGKIIRRPVQIGARAEDEGYAEIVSGLVAGERVIVADIGDRKPGSAAIVIEHES